MTAESGPAAPTRGGVKGFAVPFAMVCGGAGYSSRPTVAATLLANAELTNRGLLAGRQTVVAGHSVGEIAAYAIAGGAA